MSKENALPNIVYIFTDQQFAGAMSCAGNEYLQTPAMDRIAKAGVLFPNAYCTFPLCTPSRASMFTGQMPLENGVDENNKSLTPEQAARSLGSVLGDAGYHTIYHGKWHVPAYAISDDQGFDEIGTFGDDHVADDCVKSIQSAPKDRPFFLVASFDNPHNICEWSRGQNLPWGNVDEVDLEACPPLPVNLDKPVPPDALPVEQSGRSSVFVGAHYPDDYWRHYRYAYYRLVEKVDKEIGKILDMLDDNTVVIFSSDHGDGIGAHRWNQKWVLYDESIRVPFIIAAPGEGRRGEKDETLVAAGLDLFPTVCDYAGAEVPAMLRGKSLKARVEDAGAPEPNGYVVTQTIFSPGPFGTTGRMVRTAHYKYVVYSWGLRREQLFDMMEDPLEMRNLALEDGYEEVVDEHRQILIEWCREMGDSWWCNRGCIPAGERRKRERM